MPKKTAETPDPKTKPTIDKWPEIPDVSGIWDVTKGLDRLSPAKMSDKTVARSNDAVRLFVFTKWRIRAVIFYYKCIAEACATYPGISRQISVVTAKLHSLPPQQYSQWRNKPNRSLNGQTPVEWFAAKNLTYLSASLGLNEQPPETPK